MRFLTILFFLHVSTLYSQKTAYIPAYLLDAQTVDGSQFTWSKTAESDNFTVIWGDAAGLDPLNAPDPDLVFDPQAILDTMEWIYQQMVDYGFAWDTQGTNLHTYKIPVIMLNTFGANGVTGWAFGGDPDGVIGTFWAHPLAMKGGHVAAHELTHSLQAQCNIDYRKSHGLGPVWQHAGIFWETHANFMRNLIYPQDVGAWGMDQYHIETWGDWKNTYENYALLMAIMEHNGIDIINRLWRESLPDEFPLQAYKRLMDFSQAEFNDDLFDYARRMATYDLSFKNMGAYFRQYRTGDLMYNLPSIQATWTILQQDSTALAHYGVPIHLAPEEFAYNVIPIYPDPDSCAVIIRFKGHNDIHPHAGWRYGFVTAFPDGTVSRYSDTFDQEEEEIAFELQPDEDKMYLVVMGAPTDSITTNTTNDTWHGYPKHFRYPYELMISGGVPEGYQQPSDFRSALKTNGHLHPNGGGWIANSANVSTSVFVGTHAMVLGAAKISDNVRITHTAIVRDATISDQVVVEENALVLGGTLSGNARIAGQALSENNTIWEDALVHMRARVSNYHLHGDIEVGGDVLVYNNTGDCDNGVYYRMTNYYQDNLLECDGRTATHPDNLDVNNTIVGFDAAQLANSCHCAIYPGCLMTVGTEERRDDSGSISVYPNPASTLVQIVNTYPAGEPIDLQITDLQGRVMLQSRLLNQGTFPVDVSSIPAGMYLVIFRRNHGPVDRKMICVQH
ncbi:MAG: DUF6055 domain-containing protein [Saprospiraceae bacterium]|nr:DUF6055 domain-containing protein [Saprospiraceae bacterium]